ncbi:hypothetical protein ACFW9Q_53335, partial [Streptomyces mirabilis]
MTPAPPQDRLPHAGRDGFPSREPNPSLARCAADGMRLHFTDRATYRRKAEPETLAALLRAAG